MEPVLCAIDFSGDTPSVLTAAAALAEQFKAPLIILYTYRILPGDETIADYRNTIVKKAHDDFELLEQKLKLNGTMPYEFRAEVGFLSDRIESYLKTSRVRFIVIGRKLAFTMNEHKGTTFTDFIDHVKIPFLIVPDAHNQT
jgi:hypothetical protein